MMSFSETWGTERGERSLAFPCDRFLSHPDAALHRAVTINAPPNIVFRWLCQMRVAPYSYDWIDNRGRQSPRKLTPGLDQLAIGQDFMEIFDLVDFQQDRHVTIRVKPESKASKVFGDIYASYVIIPVVDASAANSCRLVVKVIADYPQSLKGKLLRVFLPWGDLIMMRRQLLNLKELAEHSKASPFGVR